MSVNGSNVKWVNAIKMDRFWSAWSGCASVVDFNNRSSRLVIAVKNNTAPKTHTPPQMAPAAKSAAGVRVAKPNCKSPGFMFRIVITGFPIVQLNLLCGAYWPSVVSLLRGLRVFC